MWLGDTVWAILSHAAVMCQIHEKLVEGELWAEVTGVTIWSHIKILPGMCPVIWDHFCLGVIFHSVAFWLIWYSTKRAYVIMICPSCVVVIRCRHHLASASTSVHSPPSHRIQDRNFIFSMNMHMCPQYMHIKYLVILTCSS